jgi:hypothetical protein
MCSTGSTEPLDREPIPEYLIRDFPRQGQQDADFELPNFGRRSHHLIGM